MDATVAAAEAVSIRTKGAGPAQRRGRVLVIWMSVAALLVGLGAAIQPAPANAAGSMITISRAEMEQAAKRMSLTSAQRPHVTAVTKALVSQSAAIFRKYGVDPNSCSSAGLFKLSSMNNEVNGVFQRAKGQLSRVLSSAQLQTFSRIFSERRAATKSRIVCRSASAR